jgi:hypothetical protein
MQPVPKPLPVGKGYWVLELRELLLSVVSITISDRNKDKPSKRCAIKNIER